ncbi:hypothetical protein [Saccharothrix variisporea]|uniref:Uncharacterized protein n=1 Tax=Saccharothrix variisporea TaxID=543527 RepID=A0A495X518_9PSEU|nr:hypothetical protein [Saccharothrix variisporea]RKT69411.1 hypothetical protein DFJ66_2632 [Saccharothrix variisporea]
MSGSDPTGAELASRDSLGRTKAIITPEGWHPSQVDGWTFAFGAHLSGDPVGIVLFEKTIVSEDWTLVLHFDRTDESVLLNPVMVSDAQGEEAVFWPDSVDELHALMSEIGRYGTAHLGDEGWTVQAAVTLAAAEEAAEDGRRVVMLGDNEKWVFADTRTVVPTGFVEFSGFDGARALPPPSSVLTDDPATMGLVVERHYRGEGVRHASLLTREMVISTVVGLDYDLAGAVAAFTAPDRFQKAYAQGLCDQIAEHAAEIRGFVAMADLALGTPGFGEPASLSQLLTREQTLRVASTLEDLSGHLALRAGVELPWRLGVVGWMAKVEPAPDLAVKGKAARPAVQRARAVNLARSGSSQRRLESSGVEAVRSQVRLAVFKGPGR